MIVGSGCKISAVYLGFDFMGQQAKSQLASWSRLGAFASVNANVVDHLARFISGRFGRPPLPTRRIVALAGAGCVGKSTLAEVLARHLGQRLCYDCAPVDLDGYLIERSKREVPGRIVSAYHPEAFELYRALGDLRGWLNTGRPFELLVYDKATSRRSAARVIRPADMLILEGVCAFYEPLRPLSEFKIFVLATKEIQYGNRWRRENGDLGRPTSEIQDRFERLHRDYERHVQPTIAFADVVLRVDDGYVLELDSAPGKCERPTQRARP